MPTIGIDLGTTYSCVAALRNGKIEIIPNSLGKRVTPSWVAYNDTERLVGQPAKHQASQNPENTLYQIKRLIGRMFNDKTVQEDMKLWNFQVAEDSNKPKIKVKYKTEITHLWPEQISAVVLAYLKKCAKAYLGSEVKDAVITVPAYFNDAQRRATIDAGRIAGLNVLQIINEPTAAAIAYGLQQDIKTERTILVFDFGGGTFDVTIIKIKDRKYEVLATGGDTHLGGEDINAEMFKHFVELFKSQHGCNIESDLRSRSRLLNECERVKIELSTKVNESVYVDNLYGGYDFICELSRSKFEAWNQERFQKTINTVVDTIKNAGLTKNQIDDIVLAGGSTRIPKIQELLENYFKEDLLQTINADEAVAYGAACQAAILNNEAGTNTMYDLDICDATPLSLGVESNVSNDMVVVVPRSTKIPTKKWKNFTTRFDDQTTVAFPVYEGERPYAKDNHHLGTFRLKNIPPQPRGKPSISVRFSISKSGTLEVTATDEDTGNDSSIEISDNQGRLGSDEIDKMIREAEQFEKDDDEYRKRSVSINKLEKRVHEVRQMLQKLHTQDISKSETKEVLDTCSETMKWIDNNKKNATMARIQAKRDELEKTASSIAGPSQIK